MSVRSMTGFARVRTAAEEGEFTLSVKSVNHRALDLHFHLPPELDPFEAALRRAIKTRVARGHVQIHMSFTPAAGASEGAINKPLLAAYLGAFEAAAKEFGISGKPDLNVALRIPGMLRGDAAPELKPELEKSLVALMDEALAALNKFREREGAAIAEEMRSRCGTILEQVAKMEKIRAKATAAFQKRLKERLAELLRGASIDPQRIAQEAALLADRSDVSEELIRLKTHAGQVESLLKSDGEAGKKLDFLLQEMNREANTILSKTGGLGELGLTITELALAAKSEIDKIREQSLNLE
jgi:uncharacterized protein (TIGR00255 family)